MTHNKTATKEEILMKFKELYQGNPLLIRAPGRINLIGEHTDYNNGWVLPASINRQIFFAIQKNDTQTIRLFAYDLQESYEIKTAQIKPLDKHWANYPLGVIAQFMENQGFDDGIDCVFGGNIPIGKGVSSSAAIECGFAFGLNHLYNYNLDKLTLAKMAQKAEHTYAGVKCGIMDQYAILFGKNNTVVKLDCDTLKHEYAPFHAPDISIVLCDTGVHHSLASSEYNKRRNECKEGVAVVQKSNPDVKSLRDISPDLLNKHKAEMSDTVYNRCSYVIEENERLENAVRELANDKLEAFGQHMYQSHAGLRDKYEVSCVELDQLVDIAKTCKGVIGARMMGGGFGGCTINLVRNEQLDAFMENIAQGYYKPKNMEPDIFITQIEDGTSVLN